VDADSKIEAVRISVAAAGLTAYGITLNEWVALATLVYLIIQIFILMPKAAVIVKSWFKK
jgi:hypothetical protein